MDHNQNFLATEKPGKLMRKYAIPCIISLLVAALYNIVDQIFIGWGVGAEGNGATNIVFPLTVLSLAIATMIGDGACSYISICLGQKETEKACPLSPMGRFPFLGSPRCFPGKSRPVRRPPPAHSCAHSGSDKRSGWSA